MVLTHPGLRPRFLALAIAAAILAACTGDSAGSSPNEAADARPPAPTPVDEGAAEGDGGDEADALELDDEPASAPRPGFVGEDDLIARETLEFTTEAHAAEYDGLEACFVRTGAEWFAYPRRRFGNFVNVEWCRGKGAHINCSGGQTRTAAGAGWSSLEVLQHDRDWPAVFGLSFTVGETPADSGFGAAVSWAAGGKGVLGDHVGVSFTDVRGGEVRTRMAVGLHHEFKVGLDPIVVDTEGTAAEFYTRVRSSPQALADEINGRLDALETSVNAALDSDTPRKCIYGEYGGRGIPPECVKKVPLDHSEKAAARERLRQYVEPRRAMATKHSAELHAKLMEVLPDECWTPR